MYFLLSKGVKTVDKQTKGHVKCTGPWIVWRIAAFPAERDWLSRIIWLSKHSNYVQQASMVCADLVMTALFKPIVFLARLI